MTALLTDNLPLLAGAPNGIKKLRELILELAVRGKLVPQDPSDEPARDLLKRIAEEKARLVAEGKIKKQKLLTEISEEEKPFNVPASWEWTRLGELGLVGSSSRVHQKDWQTSGVPFYRAREIVRLSKDGFVENELFISEELYKELSAGESAPKAGDIMLTGVGTIGVPYCVQKTDRFYFKDASVLIFKNHIADNSRYLLKYFISPLWVATIHSKSMGTTVHTLTIARANETLCPLPPLTEQHRIVAKVDELMALCDRLEAQQADAESAHAQLVQALLNSLTQASDADDFAQSWQRLAEQFHTLFTTEASIDALKQILLQLAVKGKLVPQDPCDEPAGELLKRIAEEKARLVAEGKIRKPKQQPKAAEDDISFVLPNGWEVERLGVTSHLITKGTTPTTLGHAYTSSGISFVKVENIESRRISKTAISQFISPDTDELMSRSRLEAGDVLFSIAGTIGKTCSVQEEDLPANTNQALAIIRGTSTVFLQDFLLSQLDSFVSEKTKERARGGAMPNVSLGDLSDLVLVIPPLAEQHRIVAKVDQLMALCNQLRNHLTQARHLHEQLANTLVEQAVA